MRKCVTGEIICVSFILFYVFARKISRICQKAFHNIQCCVLSLFLQLVAFVKIGKKWRVMYPTCTCCYREACVERSTCALCFYTLFLRYVSKAIINNLNEPPKVFLLSTYASEILYLTVVFEQAKNDKCFVDSTLCVYRVKWENTLK